MSFATHPRVLLADDYPGMVKALERAITPDCEVIGAVADGAAVFDAARRLQPDVVVVDVNLPSVNGLEVCRQITQADPQTKVIVITGLADTSMMEQAFAAGASAFLSKFACGGELLPAIRKALGHSEA